MAASGDAGDGVHLTARRLQDGEVDGALRLCPFEDVDAAVIARELATKADYCWMGLYAPDGRLAAVHRGMRWHRHLLLKGVFVDDGFRSSGAGLKAAFAIRDWARITGFDGILAWVERNKPEFRLAGRLRLRATGPLLHRYLVPLPFEGAQRFAPGGQRPASGTLTVPSSGPGTPAVEELLGVEQDEPGGTRLAWILDRSRLVLSGNPCRRVSELETLVAATAEVAAMTGATSLEIPYEAADLPAALALAGMGVRRLSRSPVSLGLLSFADERASSAAGTMHASFAVQAERL